MANDSGQAFWLADAFHFIHPRVKYEVITATSRSDMHNSTQFDPRRNNVATTIFNFTRDIITLKVTTGAYKTDTTWTTKSVKKLIYCACSLTASWKHLLSNSVEKTYHTELAIPFYTKFIAQITSNCKMHTRVKTSFWSNRFTINSTNLQ